MNKKAIDLKVGDIMLIEYGMPENFVSFKARSIFSTNDKVVILADSKAGSETFVMDPEEKIMVVPGKEL